MSHTRPERSDRKQWVTLAAYAELYDVDPRTVKKWAEAGLVELVTVSPHNCRTIIRVRNQPPLETRVKTSQTRTT